MSTAVDKTNILLVDDRPASLMALESALADLDQNLVKATSGREALKYILKMDFAVVLLDVHMPGMDGFETAQFIRQRKKSSHTPIIFITGYTDELHIAKGYSLGAVDYILAPVVPEVLRAKVSFFVDMFRKTRQITAQADSLQRRAMQLQKLAVASIEINSARSIERMLQTITDAARDVLDAHQSITLFLGEQGGQSARPLAVSSFTEKYASWRQRTLDLEPVTRTIVAQGRTAVRLTEAELREHPDWEIVSKLDIPPVGGGMLAAPLTARDDSRLGILYLADACDGAFTDEDEHILIQLAQKASIAIENILYAEAREANRLKDEFLATLSHELRTPLNAMLGWTRLLRTESPDEATLEHGLAVIERNVNVQTKLIEDLLDISRITSGKLRLDLKPVKLRPVLEAAVDAVQTMADAKHIALRVEPPPADVEVSGDADRLQQVFWNLLVNAVKFTPDEGRIDVVAMQDAGRLTIRVRDTGEGIIPELLPHIFERFRQADSTSTRLHMGLGVGLALVQHLVELHHGSVDAESAGAGQGATFYVHLPVYQRACEDKETGEALEQGRDAREPDRHALAGIHVLVVDDERDARELMGQIIRRHQGTVTLAGSAAEALDVVEACGPAVLVSDIAMPEWDGYGLIRHLRQYDQETVRNLPAIALTAHAGDKDVARSLEAGFQLHLAKPVEPFELVAAIARLAAPTTPAPVSLPME